MHETQAAARRPKAYVADLLHDPGLPIFAKPIESVGSEGTALLANEHDIEAVPLPQPASVPTSSTSTCTDPCTMPTPCSSVARWNGSARCELLNPPSEVLRRGRCSASWTLSPEEPEFLALREMVDRVIAATGPPDCAIHLEGIRTARGFRFLEVACRPAGWLIPDAYLAAEGIDLRVGHLHAAAGIAPSMVPALRRTGGYYAAIKTGTGNIVGHRTPMLDVPHRCTHRPGRLDPAPSPGIFTDNFVCEVVAWHEEGGATAPSSAEARLFRALCTRGYGRNRVGAGCARIGGHACPLTNRAPRRSREQLLGSRFGSGLPINSVQIIVRSTPNDLPTSAQDDHSPSVPGAAIATLFARRLPAVMV